MVKKLPREFPILQIILHPVPTLLTGTTQTHKNIHIMWGKYNNGWG